MTPLIKEVDEKLLDLLAENDTKELLNTLRTFSPSQLEYIAERARYTKQLRFWELGFKHCLKFIIPILIVSGIIGYIKAYEFFHWMEKFNLTTQDWGALCFVNIALSLMNLFDFGRMYFMCDDSLDYLSDYFRARQKKDKKQKMVVPKKLEDPNKELIEDVREILLQEDYKSGLSSTEILGILGLKIRPEILGKMLSNSENFYRKRAGNSRNWSVLKCKQKCKHLSCDSK